MNTKYLFVGTCLATLAVPVMAQEFSLEAMIEAAKGEPPITIYDSTGKIVEMAEAFTAKYGVQATGQKVSANSQLEMIIRENQANNVVADVVMITDAPAALSQLIPQGFVESWVPNDLEDKIPAEGAKADLVGEFKPTKFGFKGYVKGKKPSDYK